MVIKAAPETDNSSRQEKRLDRATAYVSDYWFPANPALIEKIQLGLREGRYDFDLPSLVSDLKTDFSLYIYCMRELVRLARSEDGNVVPSNPLQLCQNAGLENLKRILTADSLSISRHDLTGMNQLQAERYQEALISASTAEALSPQYSVDPDTAYTAALLRQLGHTLIAWNYPMIYEQVMSRLDAAQPVDVLLAQRLGFSPTLLAMKLVRQWGIAPDLVQAFEETPEDEEERAIIDSIGGTLARICKVGEALARANHPERYPTAKEDWEMAKREVEKNLGKDGMVRIQEKYAESCENYLTTLPHMFEGGAVLKAEYQPSEGSDENGLRERNPYISICTARVRNRLSALYRQFDDNGVDREDLRMLVREVIPLAEFTGGCVYTIDPGLLMLVPQMNIGTPQLRSITPVDYSLVRSNSDMVCVAYQTQEPAVEYKLSPNGHMFCALAGAFGVSQRMGVIYLELPQALFSGDASRHLVHFKAIAQALNDCLQLK